ncbi:Ribosomal RNA small subunit methyltransferase B [uncultured bacterium]|nr:Ribosomal RNA small subunit methyltransferase B [uncultured bacterium]
MEQRTKGARAAAFRVLNRVEGGDAYADVLVMKETEGLPAVDAALATEIAYGVLRWKMRLDYTIDLFASIKAKKLEHRVLNALRIGAYQLLFLTKVPSSAAVNESVKLLRKDGPRKSGFVNAVLRKLDSERAAISMPDNGGASRRISIEWSHPEWLVKRWVERYGEIEAAALCAANQEVPPRVVRVNTLASDRQSLMGTLSSRGYEVEAGKYSPSAVHVKGGGPLDAFDPAYYIQDEASQLVSFLVSPTPGSAVLDACSAPGGKTAHMAELMGNRGSIVALDKYSHRLEAVERSAARLGVGIIKTREHDSSTPLFFAEEGSFDYILCDSPCSGLGVVRRSPDIKYRRTAEDIRRLSIMQAALLDNLARYLKKGGVLVYSTCTFEPEETDEVVAGFLARNKDYSIEDAASALPGSCGELVDEKGFFRSFPHRHGMDGFFGARMRRL